MFGKRSFVLGLAFAVAGSATAFAQEPAKTPATQTATAAPAGIPDGGVPHYLKAETPEQRMARLGTTEDPGPDPDPGKHYWRFGKSFHIEKFDRRWENWDGVTAGYVRPFGFVNSEKEVYQLNDKYIWVWMGDVTPEELVVPPPPSRYTDEQLHYFETMRSEFYELTPKESQKTIRFEESSEGLPTTGSWRNSLAVADMNGDGCPDIIVPPERKGGQTPLIFLGDCKGHWKLWDAARFPQGIDYGSVAAADFNKDGHMDLVFGIHQVGVVLMLGDGKGRFSAAKIGPDFPTRRVIVADADHDGWPDVVALSEGVAGGVGASGSKIGVYFNRNKGLLWKPEEIAGPDVRVAGDWLTSANLNGDKFPDFIAASIYQDSNDTIFVSDGKGKWKLLPDRKALVPSLGYYYASTAGKFSSAKRDDAIVSYVRIWPGDLDTRTMPDPPFKTIIGIDRLSFAGKVPKRTPIVRWGGSRPILGLATGDFDGDGKLDLIYTRFDPREAVILLGDGKGGFTRARVEGLKLEPNTNYDITVADVNGDGRPDLIVMYEAADAGTTFAARDGSIHVFLNRGVVTPAKNKQ